jgi:hypothetical protein
MHRLILQLVLIGSAAAFVPNAFMPAATKSLAARHKFCPAFPNLRLSNNRRIQMTSDTSEDTKEAEKAAKLALARKLSEQAKAALIEAEKAAAKVCMFLTPPVA